MQAASSSVCLDWSQSPLQLLPGPLPCWVSVPPPSPLLQFPGPSGVLLFLLARPLLPSKPICSRHRASPAISSILAEPTAAFLVHLKPGFGVPPAILATQSLLLLFSPPAIRCRLYECLRCLVCVPLFKPLVALHSFKAEANISRWDLKGITSLARPPFEPVLLAALSGYPDSWSAGPWAFAWAVPRGAHWPFFLSVSG